MNFADLDSDDLSGFQNGASATAYSSPGVRSVFDFGTANTSAPNMETVSPHELLLGTENLYGMSAPNSAALTTLTSPSTYDASPGFDNRFLISPDFGSNDYVPGCDPTSWFPLFPSETPNKAENVEDSPATNSEELEPAAGKRVTSGHRRKSSHSPLSGSHSSVAGVKPRRKDKPLPPIIVADPTNPTLMKRARNTLAARKSRQRKAERVEELEEMVENLTAERDHFKAQLDHWKSLAVQAGVKE